MIDLIREQPPEVWVFGDYRNYYRNRVTLQLIAKGREMARGIRGQVGVVVFGYQTDFPVREYIYHGADKVYVIDNEQLEKYRVETYLNLLEDLVLTHDPMVLLIGATHFGREFAPRLAKRLKTGLTADCINLRLDSEQKLVQSAPAFGGNLIADIITPEARPQMATVRPGAFDELEHLEDRNGKVIRLEMPDNLPEERVRLLSSEHHPARVEKLQSARVVVCGGRGMGSKRKFKNLYRLAGKLGGEVGATRPAVHAGWAPEEALVGQAGHTVKPQVLFSFGISGAIQHTAGIQDAEMIVAFNKNPEAPMMKMADVAIVADANEACLTLIKEIQARIATKAD